ncbi:MAG: type II toxin-antitoxin system death-on-curing family toxin [Chloroflexota bacterium]
MNSANDKPIHYLTTSDLYNINSEIMDGDTLVRDLHLLSSAANRPMLVLFGQPQFPTLLEKAATLLESLAYHHLFMDGNKRTAVRAVTLFLELNGYEVTWDYATEYPFILEVAQGLHDIPQIVEWLGQFVRAVRES